MHFQDGKDATALAEERKYDDILELLGKTVSTSDYFSEHFSNTLYEKIYATFRNQMCGDHRSGSVMLAGMLRLQNRSCCQDMAG